VSAEQQKAVVAIREYHDQNYGPEEPEQTIPYMIADALLAARAAGLDVDDVIAHAKRTIAGDDEHFEAVPGEEPKE
jgi:hypothetical protein